MKWFESMETLEQLPDEEKIGKYRDELRKVECR